jgi:two-component system, chemotaxis family, chemotaxis protein CheY
MTARPFSEHSVRVIEQKRGWQGCADADNGASAIEIFRGLRPDAVVIDLSMPVMNGLEAARDISRIDPTVPPPDVHDVQIGATRDGGS